MALLVFAIIIVILLVLALWALDSVPVPQPANWIIRVLLILIAALIIADRAGLV